MELELKLNGLEEVKLARKTTPLSIEGFDYLCRETLQQAGIEGKAVVTPLSSYFGRELPGTRRPFSVQTEQGNFVLKPYTFYDGHEKKVLSGLNGFHSPKPRHLNGRIILEELIPYETDLLSVLKKDRTEAMRIGGETRAKLFSKGVTFYCDRNWLKDFVLSNGEWKCIDFGHARPLYKMREDVDIDHAIRAFDEFGERTFLLEMNGKFFIRSLQEGNENHLAHQEAMNSLVNMKGDSLTKANAYLSIKSALHGMYSFFDTNLEDNSDEVITSLMDELAPEFVQNFAKTLNALPVAYL